MVENQRLHDFLQSLEKDQLEELVATLNELEALQTAESVPDPATTSILKIRCTRAEFEKLLEKLVEAAHEGKGGYMEAYLELMSLVVIDDQDRPFLV